MQLLEDISTYKRYVIEEKRQEKENKKQKLVGEKAKALELRAAALTGMTSKQSVTLFFSFFLFFSYQLNKKIHQ